MYPLTTIFTQRKGRFSYSFLQFLDMHYSYETDGFWFGPVSEQKKIVCWNRCFNQTMLGKLWFREGTGQRRMNLGMLANPEQVTCLLWAPVLSVI